MGYGFTIVGVLFQGVLSALLGMGITGESAEFAQGLILVFALIMTGIGVIKALIAGDGLKGKLMGVGIHGLIWVVVLIGTKILVPVIVLAVVVLVVDHFFLGGTIFTLIHDRFAGTTEGGKMDWPIAVFEVDGTMWQLRHNYGESAVYVHGSNGKDVIVKRSDVKGHTMNTMYGELHW